MFQFSDPQSPSFLAASSPAAIMANAEENEVSTVAAASSSAAAGSSREDRLSSLPDELKASILSLLPADQAARTAVLSRQWRRAWTSVSRLHFFSSVRLPARYWSDVADSLPRLPSLLSLAICQPLCAEHAPGVDRLLRFFSSSPSASASAPESALRILRLFNTSFLLKVPVTIHPFRALRSLELAWCRVVLPECLLPGGLDALRSLNLVNVDMPRKDIEAFISGCRNLRSLTVYFRSDVLTGYVFDPGTVAVRSASLQSLKAIMMEDDSPKVRVPFAPCLQCAVVDLCNKVEYGDTDRLGPYVMELLHDLAEVKLLIMRGEVVECWSNVSMPASLCKPLRNLHKLDLCIENKNPDAVEGVACLLRSAPVLITISITMLNNVIEYDRNANPPEEYLEGRGPIYCFDHSLLNIYIRGLDEQNAALFHLLRFILLNARVLKKMEITCLVDSDEPDRVRPGSTDVTNLHLHLPGPLNELCNVDRASSGCELFFKFMPRTQH